MADFYNQGIDLIERAIQKSSYRMGAAHYHNEHELYFLESGKTRYIVGSEIYNLTAGNLIFIPSGVFHRTASQNDGTRERVLFSFDDDCVGDEYMPYLNELKVDNFVQLPEEYVYKVSRLCAKIENEGKRRDVGYAELQRLYLRELLITVSRYRYKNVTAKYSDSFLLVQSVVKYIGENYREQLSLLMLAEKYAISPSYLSKLFKATTGLGLNEYISIVRVNAAEKLLSEKKMPITRVALECGFNDSNYFSAVFKKLRGVTPKKYSLQARDN